MSSSETEDSSVERFVTTLVVSVALTVIFFLAFLITRCIWKKPYHKRPDDTPNFSNNPLKWMWTIITFSDENLWAEHGLDTITHFRLIRLCFILCFTFLLSFIILIPIHVTGSNKSRNDGDPLQTKGLAITYYSNLDEGDTSFVAHVVMMWLDSFICYIVVFFAYRRFIHDRRRWFCEKNPKNYSVMVRDLPDDLKTEKALSEWFERFYPGHTVGTHLPRLCKGLRKKRANYAKYANKLEAAHIVYEKKGERPQTKKGFLNKLGEKADAIDLFSRRSDKWKQKTLQRMSDPNHYKVSDAGFITFNNTFAARVQVIPRKDPTSFHIRPAPEPADVMWDSLDVSYKQRMVRNLIIFIVTFLLIFFWAIPVFFIASLSTLSNITSIPGFSWLDFILDISPVVRGFIEGFLPGMALIVFNILLVPIIKLFSKLQAPPTFSIWSMSTMTKYWVFLIFNTFLVVSATGAILNVLGDIIDDPVSIIDLLARALPRQATFFINFILVAIPWIFFGMWRPVGVVIYLLKIKLLAKTKRDRAAAKEPDEYFYAVPAAKYMLMLALIVTYHIMSPLIVLFGIIYFAFVYTADRYNLIYVMKTSYQGGGLFWRRAFHFIMVIILIWQGTMVGLLAISKFAPGAAIVPLPFITLLFWVATWKLFGDLGKQGCIDDKWGTEDTILDDATCNDEEYSQAFLQPEFQPLEGAEQTEMKDFGDKKKKDKKKKKKKGKKHTSNGKDDSDSSSGSDQENGYGGSNGTEESTQLETDSSESDTTSD